jgi:hypothetical protein
LVQFERARSAEGEALNERTAELGNAAAGDDGGDVAEAGTAADVDRAAVGGQRAAGDRGMLDRNQRAPAERLDRPQVGEAAIRVYVVERNCSEILGDD